MKRGLSDEFMKALKTGVLNPLLDFVQKDMTLCLEIRDAFINIYYRGGSLLKIEEKDTDKYSFYFNSDYFNTDQAIKPILPKDEFDIGSQVNQWIGIIPLLKHDMDLWFGENPKNEREFQQLLLRENNFTSIAKGTDYFICDIEYANENGRFDLVAVKWPSSGAERKNSSDLKLVFIEMKYGDHALSEKAGIIRHIEGMSKFLSEPKNINDIKDEMRTVFNQKIDLNLISNQNKITQFSEKPPEYIFLITNHDPKSQVLKDELGKVLQDKLHEKINADIKFAGANFMGYGLYQENMLSLEQFYQIVCEQLNK